MEERLNLSCVVEFHKQQQVSGTEGRIKNHKDQNTH